MADVESIMLKQGLVKVPKTETGKDNPFRRVAKFLFIIGAEQAADVLKRLEKEQVDKVIAELVTIQNVDETEALDILNEFNAVYAKNKNSIGGVKTAKSILTEAFGSSEAERILEKAVPEKRPVPFEYLQGITNDALTAVLSGELVSSKAVILSQLKPKQAADYITSIQNNDEKKEIIFRLAKMKKLDSEILLQVSEALKKKFLQVNLNKNNAIDGVSVLAEILRQTDYETGNAILDSLETEDETLVDSIRSKLITIDDIVTMPAKHLQYLIAPMQDKELVCLIHNKNEDFRNAILKNVSKTRANFILQEEEILSPIPKKEIQTTLNLFLNRVKEELKKGKIVIGNF